VSLTPVNIDYTDKDFDSLRARLVALVHTVFPEWSDESTANFGNILLELFCFVGDVLAFYLDNHALESRIVTATQRRSLIALCKLIGFEAATATAATADVVFSIPTTMAGTVTIPAGTIVSTVDVVDPVSFQLLTPAVIPAGQLSVSHSVEQSAEAEDAFTSDGLADQEFILAATPYLGGSTLITAGDGAYTEVDNFLTSFSTDRHFVVLVDQDDRAQVRFGSGTSGSIPAGTITVTYRTGGGSSGNVQYGTITRVEGNFTDSLSTPVTVSVTNPSKAANGTNAMTNAQIKSLAPASIRAPRNSISREDFGINAKRVAGVARALMVTVNEDAAIEENTGDLYIIPEGGGAPSSALKAAVTTMVTVTYPPPLTFALTVKDPVFRAVDVTATIFLSRGAVAATVKAAVMANLATFFSITNADGSENALVDFGANLLDETGTVTGLLAFSDLYNVVRDSEGVVRVGPGTQDFLLNGEHDDIFLGPREFPVLGSVTLINGLSGVTL
jgi:hypothetical protein